MSDWSVSLHRVGRNVIEKMSKEGVTKASAYIYDSKKRPLGVVTVERKYFDPNTGD